MGSGCLFPEGDVYGDMEKTLRGFAVSECVSGTFVDVTVWHVFNSVANVH